METFKLKKAEPFIELNNLLQVMSYVSSGGEAKIRIKQGEVFLNGIIETQIRKKIRAGDVVSIGSEKCKIS